MRHHLVNCITFLMTCPKQGKPGLQLAERKNEA